MDSTSGCTDADQARNLRMEAPTRTIASNSNAHGWRSGPGAPPRSQRIFSVLGRFVRKCSRDLAQVGQAPPPTPEVGDHTGPEDKSRAGNAWLRDRWYTRRL